jgi:hypothetical protein
MNQPLYPQREGEPECRDFIRTGRCKYGDSCKYHHPIGGTKPPSNPNEPPFPIRPNDPPCQYYLKNGTCKFGQSCKFHHPPHLMGKTSSTGLKLPREGLEALTTNGENEQLPQRPTEPECLYYLKHGRCKYGATCKYHHPSMQKMRSDSDVSRLVSSQGQMLYRERTSSGTSYTDMRDGSLSVVGKDGKVYTILPDQQRRVVDSVPKNILGTISNSYPHYNSSTSTIEKPMQPIRRYLTPLSSPKMESPSITSSTLASSFETAGSGFERLPAARTQIQNSSIRSASFSHVVSNAHRRNGSDPEYNLYSESQMYSTIEPPPHQAFNFHQNSQHSSSGHYSPGFVPSSDGTFSSRKHSFSSDFSSNSLNQQNRNADDTDPISFSFLDTSSPNRNVDDGLSMMTSALLNMMDTPSNRRGDNIQGNSVSPDLQTGSLIATTPPTSNLIHRHENHHRANKTDNNCGLKEIPHPLWN